MPRHETIDIEERLTADFAWAESSPAVQQDPEHFGKLVVVYNKQIVAVGRDRQALLELASKQAGVPAAQLVVVLVPRPGLWEIPS
jgi:hypothetical protein